MDWKEVIYLVMQQVDTMVLGIMVVIFILLIVFLVSSGAFIINRAQRSHNKSLYYLSLFFISLATSFIITIMKELGISVFHVLSTAVDNVVVIAGFLFVQKAFFTRKKKVMRVLFIIAMILEGVNYIYAILQEIPVYEDIGRLGRTWVGNLVIIMVSLNHAFFSLRDYSKVKPTHLTSRVKIRYLLFGLASISVTLTSVLDIIGTNLAIYLNIEYFLFLAIIFLLTLFYCTVNFSIWVILPQKFNEMGSKIEISNNFKNKIPSIRGTRSIHLVDYFGDWLCSKINKNPSACKGLLLVAINSELGPEGLYWLNYSGFVTVVKNTLRNNLAMLKVPNINEIISDFLHFLEENKSLFAMVNS